MKKPVENQGLEAKFIYRRMMKTRRYNLCNKAIRHYNKKRLGNGCFESERRSK